MIKPVLAVALVVLVVLLALIAGADLLHDTNQDQRFQKLGLVVVQQQRQIDQLKRRLDLLEGHTPDNQLAPE